MKTKLLFGLLAVCLMFGACKKDNDEENARNYAAEMVGEYSMSATTVLYDASGARIDGEEINGMIQITNPSDNKLTVVMENFPTAIQGTVDKDGVFHLNDFNYFGVAISEKNSNVKLNGKVLSGTARCKLVQGSETREADLTITANKTK